MARPMKSFLLLFITVLGIRCSNIENKVTVDDTQAENVSTVKQMFEAFNRHDWEAMASFYIDTAEFLDPSFGTAYVKQTRNETAAKYATLEKMYPDVRDNVVAIYSMGDVVGVQFVSSGTDSLGQKFSLPIGCFLTLKNGKIVKDATYYDQ
jgi:ketosteroid isomerase-like protein